MSESRTVIGRTAMVRGHLEGQEDLVVAGRVEGTISLSESLMVESSGVVQADINVKSAVVHGVLIGNIDAVEQVTIADGGRVVGDIRAPEVVLNEGAAFRGHIDMGEFDLEARSSTTGMHATPEPVVAAAPRPLSMTPGATYSKPSVEPVPSKTTSFAPRYSAPPEDQRAGVPSTDRAWSSPNTVSRGPAPRPSTPVASSPTAPPRRPAAPVPKVRNIGRAKARRHQR